MQLPFGEWLPDQPDHLKQGANVATMFTMHRTVIKDFLL